MNKVILIGRNVTDIELKGGETAVARFRIAVDRIGKKDEADFLTCVAFGKTAEALSKFSGKGKRIGIEGHIQTGSYTNKDGKTVYTTDIIVDRADIIDFVEKAEPQQSSWTPPKRPEEFTQIDIDDERLPFNQGR